jgi:thiosulfate/3-mercaptopyruvate sulfurtransferase
VGRTCRARHGRAYRRGRSPTRDRIRATEEITMAPSLTALVDPETLRAALDAPSDRPVVLDASTSLVTHGEGEPYTAGPLRAHYLAAHVPGAAFVDVTGELSDPAGPHPFTLPSPEALAAASGTVGIGDDTHVVVYDTVGSAWATRVW